jgi:peptidoglycan/LPS O-acetylase OafA/YrhL
MRRRAGHLGLVAMIITVLGSALFLPEVGGLCVCCTRGGQAYLAGIEEFAKLPSIFADTVFVATSLLVVVLLFMGNVLLGVAIWRSGTLPRWAGALWAGAAVLMYPLGLVIAAAVTGSTPPTVLVGAMLIVIGGAWMAWSVLGRGSTEAVGVTAQPRVRCPPA